MKVKFNKSIGDTVWVMKDNKPKRGVISEISYIKSISCFDFETVTEHVYFDVLLGDVSGHGVPIRTFDENSVFNTKKELIESL